MTGQEDPAPRFSFLQMRGWSVVHLTDDITDPRLAKALAHPLRLEILRRLGDRTASPSEIAEEIGAPLTNVSYHVRKLRALGMIKLVKKTPKRGVIEHYYSAQPRQRVSDDAWEETPPIVKAALLGPTVKDIAHKLATAASAGGFDRSDMHLSTNYMTLDLEGWQSIAKLLADTLEGIGKVEEGVVERLKAKPDTETFTAGSVMALFEMDEESAKAYRPTPAPKRASGKRRRSATTA
jgi:DNA-binding transcriptional ArsR family regulator